MFYPKWVCFVQGMDHIDPMDAFAAEMCIGPMRKCGRVIPNRNNYWNKVKNAPMSRLYH